MDSAEQAPASSYEGFDRYTLTNNSLTVSKTPVLGKSWNLHILEDGTGGWAHTLNASQFRNAAKVPAPWPDANSLTVYSFQCDDYGAGAQWQFIGAVFDV